ncbi:MAG: tRNA (adenosine(37)-N6)-threonylcarbamoyltransferase complex transferase subunit TsaD [Spiroplasma sp.]|nr:tRNA (adenosine(37)-N6)-threonylcarbamoyltransferase complex transferase subunit TsaD [Spiroplasma sp.]
MTILAIETSCDETSVAIIENQKVLSNIVSSQINLHRKYGGVVPELAARAHSENIAYVLDLAIKDAKIKLEEINFVAYTNTPGLISCLHVGKVVAQTIASYLQKPLVACNHLFGHVYASLIENQWQFPVLGLLVSGGHTQLLALTKHLQFQTLGQTLDDAVGECYDKVARMLGLTYPGGPEIDQLAKKGQDTYSLPLPKNDQTLDFSFSGLKSAAAKIINQEGNQLNLANFSCSLQKTIVKILIIKLELAIKQYQPKTVVLAGGVSANSSLRSSFFALKAKYPKINFIAPSLEYCTDNAAMIGILASYQIKRNKEG